MKHPNASNTDSTELFEPPGQSFFIHIHFDSSSSLFKTNVKEVADLEYFQSLQDALLGVLRDA